MEAALKSVPFLQPARAQENLARLQRELPPAAHQKRCRACSPTCLTPIRHSTTWNASRLAATPEVRDYLGLHPPAVHHLLSLFAHSQYLSDTLIRQPELALWLEQEPTLHRVKTHEEISHSLSAFADEPQQAGVRAGNAAGPVQAA